MKKRQLYQTLFEKYLALDQMLFITGPRQAGKTTLAKALLTDHPSHQYLNWDIIGDRKLIRTKPHFYESLDRFQDQPPLIIFDEIHKYSHWKNYLKGVFDRDKGKFKFIVTGSGRLDAFRKGGDSLAGRYFLTHVWPFTLAEQAGHQVSFGDFLSDPLKIDPHNDEIAWKTWKKLEELSGFPTPYLSGQKEIYRVWSETYRNQLVREDIRNLSGVLKIDELEALVEVLPTRIGSPLSLNNVATDLGVSFDSVKSWLEILDRFFLTFRISPFTAKLSRAIKKEQKLYLFDAAQIEDPAARFENMVALELLRAITTWRENGWGEFGLKYIRTKEKEECDFIVIQKNKPLFLVECKLSDPNVSKSLFKFQDNLKIPALQLVNDTGILRRLSNGTQNILVVSAHNWISGLP